MIRNNPFYILGASTIDNRQKIIKLAEEKSFQIDEDLCQKARSDLTVPKNRTLAELDWFVGVSQKKVELLITQLKISDKLSYEIYKIIKLYLMEGLPNLSIINILMEFLDIEDVNFNTELESIIIDLAHNFENLNIYEIIADINRDRVISGFAITNDYKLVQDHLNQKKRICVKLVIKQLNYLDILDLVSLIRKIVNNETSKGEKQAPTLIEDLVDNYKLNVQNFLNNELEEINKLIEFIKIAVGNSEDSIFPLIEKLLRMVRNWTKLAYPIKISMISRGLKYEIGKNFAFTIRSLSIDLANNYNYIESSLKIMKFLKEVFTQPADFVQMIKKDIKTLNEIKDKKDKDERGKREFKNNLNYSVEIGIFIQHRLTITSKEITWKNKTYPLETISRLTWGGTNHFINEIPTRTTYSISFGDDKNGYTIETMKENVYKEVIDKLLSALSNSILTKLLNYFKKGKSLTFRNITIFDNGIRLMNSGKWFDSKEKKKFRWNEIQIYSSSGNLIIQSIKDSDFTVTIPYQDMYNVHFIEHLIRMTLKENITKFSDLIKQ